MQWRGGGGGGGVSNHADAVVQEPPEVNFTAVGLQYVLTQGKRQVVVQQPHVPKQICSVKRHEQRAAKTDDSCSSPRFNSTGQYMSASGHRMNIMVVLQAPPHE